MNIDLNGEQRANSHGNGRANDNGGQKATHEEMLLTNCVIGNNLPMIIDSIQLKWGDRYHYFLFDWPLNEKVLLKVFNTNQYNLLKTHPERQKRNEIKSN